MAVVKKTSEIKNEGKDITEQENVEVKEPLVKKTPVKKTSVKKTTEKKTVTTTRKSTESKIVQEANIFVQYNNKETDQKKLVKFIVEKWCAETGKKDKDIKDLNIYIKPEDNAAYYVINGQGDSIEL